MVKSVRNFAFLLVPGFSLVALSCAIDVLRAANVESESKHFDWALLSEDGNSVASSSGIELSCQAIGTATGHEAVAVCGGERSHLFNSNTVHSWLRSEARHGRMIGALSDGAYVVAAAGLFKKVRSTIHWKCQGGYRERYPELDVRTSILEVDGNRFSCAGGTASLDLMLRFVSEQLGPEVVGRIADNYFHDVIRGDNQVQHMTSAFRFAARNKTLSDALLIMESELENPVPLHDLADQLRVSHRQLARLFRRFLDTSPSLHYREMRLARASALLKQTGMSITEISLGCGFQSASQLSRHFKTRYGETPREHRKTG